MYDHLYYPVTHLCRNWENYQKFYSMLTLINLLNISGIHKMCLTYRNSNHCQMQLETWGWRRVREYWFEWFPSPSLSMDDRKLEAENRNGFYQVTREEAKRRKEPMNIKGRDGEGKRTRLRCCSISQFIPWICLFVNFMIVCDSVNIIQAPHFVCSSPFASLQIPVKLGSRKGSFQLPPL